MNYMLEALKQAKKAEQIDEVPVGCVIVKDGKIIARSHNLKERQKNPLSHAEINCIQKACKKLDSMYLIDCDMYVTLEPCVMCSGALVHSRLRKVYFGAYDFKSGAVSTKTNILDLPFLNHKVEYEGGIEQEKCSSILSNYFKRKRGVK